MKHVLQYFLCVSRRNRADDRDRLPGTRLIAPLYRGPICITTSAPNRGDVQFIP